jgi:ribokinase
LITITVVGSVNLDLVATVERLPAPGETVGGSDFGTTPGGKGANQALAARRAGAQVRMIGAVGKDAFASEALSLLEEGGVDLSHVRRMHAPTGTALILVDPKGENVIAVVPGANGSVLPGDLSAAELKKGDYLLLQQEIPLPTVEAALRHARQVGAISVLNTAPFRPEAAVFIGEADYVVANETEFDLYADALSLAKGERPDRMSAFAQRTGRTVIVTLGAEGLLAEAPGQALSVPALKVSPVDTVGAGDTFCGYLAASLASGMKLESALRRAVAAASLACTKEGAQPSVPLAAEVDRAMKG